MNISFRHGIINTPTALNGPNWLQATNGQVASIDLVIPPGNPVTFTIAHYAANYLFAENNTIVGAWGNGSGVVNNGPLPANTTTYLYWDVDLATGALSHGWTLLEPLVTSGPPVNPVVDQHYFDTVDNVMRVYSQTGTNPGVWLDKLRLFAGTYTSNAVIVPRGLGSQVGLSNGFYTAGNLLLGTNLIPLKQSDGTFVTTSTQLIVQQTSGQNVQFDTALIFARATEDIPAYYLVTFQPGRTIGLASSNLNAANTFVSGIVVQPLPSQATGQVIVNGVVTSDQFMFTPDQIGLPLFCGPSGQLLLTPAPAGFVQQVATVYDTNSIYMNIFAPVRVR